MTITEAKAAEALKQMGWFELDGSWCLHRPGAGWLLVGTAREVPTMVMAGETKRQDA